ncbi:hypothetical protein MIT9_P2062 [Methylomarinovum caldicuralii]|uniref:RNA polymerase sigma-70 domain-containing protein n=1 Tax=Methylomarinovum caldicuralii TaxID=438856 RepID=A0AAU9CA58_9GAMM|nr:sigma-70 family RNA polymerase sigma factor [Methylomarinovum caldicuralii]BCX82476.1 hypothetical protein MIT9_P2062 [Methylomarinovum caldicuralii]
MYRNTSGDSQVLTDEETPASRWDGHGRRRISILEDYLDRIGRFPLLSPRQEQELGRRIQRCTRRLEARRGDTEDRRQSGARGDPGTPKSDAEIVHISEGLQQAICKLVEHNLRLVVREACRYRRQRDSLLLDLIQEGNLGLLRAARKFDPGRGGRFSTYAVHWIRLFIDRAAHRISTPLTMSLDEAGRRRREGRTIPSLSLDDPRAPENLGELLRTDDTALWADLDRARLAALIEQGLDTLNRREAEILKLRFGLKDEQIRTLQHIADRLGVSRERVRQIEKAALEKLRRKFHNQWQSLLP